MFRAFTVAIIMAAGLAVAACGTDHAPTETGWAPSFRTEHSPPGPGAKLPELNLANVASAAWIR